MSHKRTAVRQPYTERIGQPGVTKDPAGVAVLLCPFCKPSHPLDTGGASACGTILQVRAVQIVYKAKFNKDLICVKCQKGGGAMVHFNNAYTHTHDCMPGVLTIIDDKNFSKAAKFVFNLPKRMKPFVEKYTGEARPVDEVMDNGTRTGKNRGYVFFKRAT